MNMQVVNAIFKRNFAAYFTNPIGYVFICAFVLLTGCAAFWPNEFFNANLATLDQLNRYLPWIMLVFIPAITMSIWAEERRQGTDELVLTLPCTDLDVVIGKYAAAVAIYTVALIFSFSNIIVLLRLGSPDLGLLLGNYLGYWLVGAAMIAIGMVASFLTNSLTVGFVLALAFNSPLVLASWASDITGWDAAARFIQGASISEQFDDFGKGLLTLSGIVFFVSIIAVCLYLSMVLIGRRHWASGSYGTSMAGHFTVRGLALVAIAIGVNVLAGRFDVRADLSNERINSLSPQTAAMLTSLEASRPIYVEAYVSPEVPEEFVQTRLNLLSMLEEVHAEAGDKVVVRVHDTPRFSEVEAQAEQVYGIRPQAVPSTTGGKMSVDEITLGAAFTCGLDKVVVPFFDRGIPVEYEIIRSIATVSQQQRKKIGVLSTDAKLYGGFDIDSMSSRPDEQIIVELKKQYDVIQVNADQPITETYDALLAVQPSTLTPQQMDNFLAAVGSGQPTAIFEDPFPYLDSSVTPTSQPRNPRNRNPFMQQPPPEPKGDVNKLWDLLGVQFHDRQIIWQNYNPQPKLGQLPPEFLWLGKGSNAQEPFCNSSPITSGLQQVILLFGAALEPMPAATTRLQPLLTTGPASGTVAFDQMIQRGFFGQANLNPNRPHHRTGQQYVMAARVTGAAPIQPASTQPEGAPALSPINAIVVGDIDVLYSVFFGMRARGSNKNDPVELNLDNVTFVLNALDELTGDERFIELRKRRPMHRTLTSVEERTQQAKDDADKERERFMDQFEAKRTEAQKKLDDRINEIKARQGVDPQQMGIEVATAQQQEQNRLDAALEKFEKDRDAEIDKIERNLALQIRDVQDRYKLMAIAFPPILPLVLGAAVFFRRRSMEHIGVPRSRLR